MERLIVSLVPAPFFAVTVRPMVRLLWFGFIATNEVRTTELEALSY